MIADVKSHPSAVRLEADARASAASGQPIMSSDLPIRAHASRASSLFAAVTLLGVLLSFFFALGRAPLFDVDEAAFSQATIEMFERGDFLSTYLNGQPYYDKPILVFWLQAASVKLFGVNEFAFRFPSAVCASIWALLTFLFTRRRFGTNTALLAAGVMATSLGVYIIGRAGTTDALLNVLIAASMFAAWLHLETGKRAWLYAAFAAIGFGFLAKGPVAILIPFSVTLLFCLMRRDVKTWARAVFDYRGLLLFAAVALPWYVLILHREGWAFVQGFFLKHNVYNFLGTLHGHSGSVVYYIPVVLIGTLPFTAFFIRAVMRAREAWRDDLQCYLWLWFGFVFVFFSLSGT
jgi:4-amino-4-deoxy-L-arabinose transferase-like glycosyltransferase